MSLEIIRQENRALTSLLQYRLNLSFKPANALIIELTRRGILGPGEGAQPREIRAKRSRRFYVYLTFQR